MNSMVAGKKLMFVLPQAPSNSSGMTEWWTINVMEWAMAMQQKMTGQGDKLLGQLIRKMPPGLKECRARMATLLEEVTVLAGVPHQKIMLAGFSQGAISSIN